MWTDFKCNILQQTWPIAASYLIPSSCNGDFIESHQFLHHGHASFRCSDMGTGHTILKWTDAM